MRLPAGSRMPGGQSRWSQGKDLSWEPLRPELVVEVAYEHMQGRRFRHMAHFRRWRTDKGPADCTYAQLEVVVPHELEQIFVRRTLAGRRHSLSCVLRSAFPPCARRIVIGVGRFLRRPHSSGTWRRFTRIRVHVEDLPRILSTSTSSIAKCAAASVCLLFHRSRPARAACSLGEFAITSNGIFVRGCPLSSPRGFSRLTWRVRERRGAPRLQPCGNAAAMAHHQDLPLRRELRDRVAAGATPAAASIAACGSPISAKRFGMVKTVKSAGSQSETSCQ